MRIEDVLYNCWEIIFAIIILVAGAIIYGIATRNRGGFVDAPDWSMVIRRIVELICVLICMILVVCFGWSEKGLVSLLLPIPPILVLATVFLAFRDINRRHRGSNEEESGIAIKQNFFRKILKNSVEKLSVHMLNATVLALFIMSGAFFVFVTLAKIFNFPEISTIMHTVLSVLLSLEFLLLAYHLYDILANDSIPSNEIKQIIRICNDLNE